MIKLKGEYKLNFFVWLLRSAFYMVLIFFSGFGLESVLQKYFGLNLQNQYCSLAICIVLLIILFIPIKNDDKDEGYK
jgi:hypothetical protein